MGYTTSLAPLRCFTCYIVSDWLIGTTCTSSLSKRAGGAGRVADLKNPPFGGVGCSRSATAAHHSERRRREIARVREGEKRWELRREKIMNVRR